MRAQGHGDEFIIYMIHMIRDLTFSFSFFFFVIDFMKFLSGCLQSLRCDTCLCSLEAR